MSGLWFTLLVLFSFCNADLLKTRRGCLLQIPSARLPAKYDDGPLVASENFIYLARGGFPCETNSDLWRLKRASLEFVDSLPNSGECVKLTSGSITNNQKSLYFGANDGYVYKVDTKRWMVTGRLDVGLNQASSSIIDDSRNLGFFADNNPLGNSTIVKVNLTDFTVMDRVLVNSEHVGQIAPALHPNGKEVLFMAYTGIVRVDIEKFTVTIEDIHHGFVFTRGPGSIAVVAVDRMRVSLLDLDTMTLIPSGLDDATNEIGTPWIIEWFWETNSLLVIYDLGSFATFEYRYQYYDMSDYSIIDDGTLRGPDEGLLRKTDTGLYDRYNSTVYLRFYQGDSIIGLNTDRCHLLEDQKPVQVEPTPSPLTTNPSEPLTATEKEYFLAVIIVGAIVAVLLLIAIGIGVLLVVQRLPVRKVLMANAGYDKE